MDGNLYRGIGVTVTATSNTAMLSNQLQNVTAGCGRILVSLSDALIPIYNTNADDQYDAY